MKRIIETFRIYEYRRVTETDDKPSLAPMPASAPYVETDGEDASEQSQFRPLRKCAAPSTMAVSMGRRRR